MKNVILEELKRLITMIRTVLYVFLTPIVLWAMDSIKINNIFKKNRVIQANVIYLIISLCLTYLLVNFFMDFFIATSFL